MIANLTQSATVGPTHKKRGRPRLSNYGNEHGKSPQLIRVTRVCKEQVDQIKIVDGLNISQVYEAAVRTYFMIRKRDIIDRLGQVYWDQLLKQARHVDQICGPEHWTDR